MRFLLISLLVIVLVGCGGQEEQRLHNTVEDGTADGQLLFWIDSISTWAHTEISEIFWDDLNKSLGIGPDSNDDTNKAYLVIENDTLDISDSYSGYYVSLKKTAGVTDIFDDYYGGYISVEYDQNAATIGDMESLKTELVVSDGTVGGSATGISTDSKLNDGDIAGNMNGCKIKISQDGTDIAGNVFGVNVRIDQNSGSLNGNAYGMYIYQDYDGVVNGSTHGIYLKEFTGQDYGFYQDGSAPNIFGGSFALGVDDSAGDVFRIKPGNDLSGDVGLTIDDSQQSNVGVHTNTPKSRLDVDNSLGCDIDSLSSNFTLNDYYFTVVVDVDDGFKTITLPQANTCDGRIYCIKVEDMEDSGYALIIDAHGSETVDGGLGIILAVAYSSVIIQSDGTNNRWMILGSHGL